VELPRNCGVTLALPSLVVHIQTEPIAAPAVVQLTLCVQLSNTGKRLKIHNNDLFDV
jgi:hypothetical protein